MKVFRCAKCGKRTVALWQDGVCSACWEAEGRVEEQGKLDKYWAWLGKRRKRENAARREKKAS